MKYLKYSSAFLLRFSFFIFFILLFIIILIDWIRFIITPVIPINQHQGLNYILPAGGSVRVLADDLINLNLLNHKNYFIFLAYIKNYAKHLHAGEYHFYPGETSGEILKQIADGKVLWRKMTFSEGATFNHILQQMETNPLIVHELAGFPPMIIMMKLNLFHHHIYPEGLFFPETYVYTAGMTDKKILLQAYRLMQKRLSLEWQHKASDLPYENSYQALIAASIIEKEAMLESERKEISEVIKRRLNKNMLLQMDTTVIYAIEESGVDFHAPLRRNNLKIDSLYNTYIYKGLPPTPICMPSEESIHAALHPSNSNALYFVSKGNGTSQFSATYVQQVEAINQFEK